MNIPSWATVAYHWGNCVCYSDGVSFVGYTGGHEIWKGKWESPGTQSELEWISRMEKGIPSFRKEEILLIEENE